MFDATSEISDEFPKRTKNCFVTASEELIVFLKLRKLYSSTHKAELKHEETAKIALHSTVSAL